MEDSFRYVQKKNSLMQAILGNIPITDSSITEEASQLIKLGQRMGNDHL